MALTMLEALNPKEERTIRVPIAIKGPTREAGEWPFINIGLKVL